MGVPEGPQSVQNGQKRPFRAISGTGGFKLAEVWNKGGTSQGTSPVMHWNSFGGQGGPYGCARGPPKRSKTAKNSLLGPYADLVAPGAPQGHP